MLVSWRQLLFQGFTLKSAWCYELRTKTNTRPLAGRREAEVARAKGRRWSAKASERDQCRFPKRWRPASFSPSGASAGWLRLSRKQLELPEKRDPRPRESCTRRDSCPQSATKHPATRDRGGWDSRPGNWNGLGTRKVFPECSLLHETLYMVLLEEGRKPQGWLRINFPPLRMGLEMGLIWFTENKISCTLKFETKSVSLYT